MLGIFYDVVYIMTVRLGCCCNRRNHGLVFFGISTHFQYTVTEISKDAVNTLDVVVLLLDVFVKTDELGGKTLVSIFQTG